jgi:hypothetical protein
MKDGGASQPELRAGFVYLVSSVRKGIVSLKKRSPLTDPDGGLMSRGALWKKGASAHDNPKRLH